MYRHRPLSTLALFWVLISDARMWQCCRRWRKYILVLIYLIFTFWLWRKLLHVKNSPPPDNLYLKVDKMISVILRWLSYVKHLLFYIFLQIGYAQNSKWWICWLSINFTRLFEIKIMIQNFSSFEIQLLVNSRGLF